MLKAVYNKWLTLSLAHFELVMCEHQLEFMAEARSLSKLMGRPSWPTNADPIEPPVIPLSSISGTCSHFTFTCFIASFMTPHSSLSFLYSHAGFLIVSWICNNCNNFSLFFFLLGFDATLSKCQWKSPLKLCFTDFVVVKGSCKDTLKIEFHSFF